MTSNRSRRFWRSSAALAAAALLGSAACGEREHRPVLTFSGSVVGREGEVLRRQLSRFQERHPSLEVQVRATPDGSDERHQLYVQWLNANARDPDVLQLDVVWTAEFAAARWILGLDRFQPDVGGFFAAAVQANRWNGRLYALPWFVDVGMLYWRKDLVGTPPATLDELTRAGARAQSEHKLPYGLVWSGARYEGLVTVFVEYLGAFGGQILDERGRVLVDSDASVRALTTMRDALAARIVPPAALTWQEEQVRFAFQNGQAAFMRNWPYAYAILDDPTQSQVAGRVGVAPMPAAAGGQPTAALGGSELAISAFSDRPVESYALVEFLLEPAQMIERASVAGQFPSRPALYDSDELAGALKIAPSDARRIVERAVPRPATPVYAQLSEVLQVALHRVLTQQEEPRAALEAAARAMRSVLAQAGLERDAS